MVILFGNFLGKEDQWNTDMHKTFIDKNQILKLFKDFDFIYFHEQKFYKDSLVIKNKYWHIFELIAKKKI